MLVLHIDMDSYFASIEQQANPRLRGRPIVVSGRPDIHSVVAAASREAKRYGIHAGMTTWEAKRLCPQVTFVAGNPDKYLSLTRRFFQILLRYTPDGGDVLDRRGLPGDLAGGRAPRRAGGHGAEDPRGLSRSARGVGHLLDRDRGEQDAR